MQTNQFYRVETDTEIQPNRKEEKPENKQEKKRIYVFVDAVPEEELLADLQKQADQERTDVESVEIEEQAPLSGATGERVLRPGTRKPARLLLLPSILLAFFAILAGGSAYVFFFQSVSVTIVPDSRQVQASGIITIVTAAAPDTSQNQIPGRVLPTLSMSQPQTTATTGVTNQEARPGRGIITFYNSALFSQTIAAGTLITGADGVQVATDYAVTVPAEALPTLGSVTVTAHALQPGTAGNIKAGDIYNFCCLLNIQAVNSAFTGGEAAEKYHSVAQSDIDTTAANLKIPLIQSITAALQIHVQSSETLVTPLQCSPSVTADNQVGAKASLVQVTLTEACTAVTYDTASFEAMLRRVQTQAASRELRDHYQLLGSVHAAIQTTSPGSEPGTYQLSVQTRATWVYHFSQRDQQHLASQIAGMSTSQATNLLLHVPGVRRVSFGSGIVALPLDPQHIHFLFVVPQEGVL